MQAFLNSNTVKTERSNDDFAMRLIGTGVVVVDAKMGVARSVRWVGKNLGCRNPKGYIVCTLHDNGDRRQIKVHRLIWMSVNGEIPSGMMIDHINGKKGDNRISNLRLADAKLNAKNRRSYAGKDSPAVKLSLDEVVNIRRLHPQNSYSELALGFGVSKSLIAKIIRREIWL